MRLTEGAGNGCNCNATAGRLGCAKELERHRLFVCCFYVFDDGDRWVVNRWMDVWDDNIGESERF